MAASGQHIVGEVCYSPGLRVFNDGLNYGESPPRSMIIRVSVFHDQHESRCHTTPAVHWLSFEDSWKLPSPNEVCTDRNHPSGLWIGWFLPDFQIRDGTRMSRWDSLPRGRSVSNHKPIPSRYPSVQKAFKAIYKPGREGDTKLFALCTPDANGICQAKVVPQGARNIFFFKEWRDDTLCGSWARQGMWTMNAKVGASKIYSKMNASINQPANKQQHASESEYEDCLEKIVEEDDEDEESEYAESDNGGSESEKEQSEEDFEQEGLLEPLRPSPPEFASSSESESDSLDEDEYHSNGHSIRRESQPTPKHDIKANISARITSELRSNLQRRPASSRTSTHVNHGLLSRHSTNLAATADTPVGNGAKSLKRSQSPMLGLSSKSEKKRRINLQVESPPDSTRKRHAPSVVNAPLASRPERAQSLSRRLIKNEATQESDDEIHFIKEVPKKRPQQMTTKVDATIMASSETSITYISKFVAAGKLLQLARLPDTFSRKIMLESFSKHLKSTNLAQFDALGKNIVDSEEESVRVMIAETLEEQLKGRLPIISGA
ncbi:hypothetical protein CNYM01_00157 [Colletotrichum nymphaeae SA-01]|uniref:Uncharacterized protein n=1 Tax=Colletotrichum nymphaeae SA-01 TaxID=1460502 RepID=A0A135UJV1_9PEZI|nr:hypothetical protein CNYM01_00157 [Colletotrichum nymphaeae SA-01]